MPNPLRAMVVEDSPTMSQLITFALHRIKGLEVVQANNGAEALKKLASGGFDIIITDINMPIMDGLKLIAQVRKEEATQHLPVVVITTEGASADMDRAKALGVDAYITKPIQSAQVVECVSKLLKL